MDEASMYYRSFDTRDFDSERIRPSETDASLILWEEKTGEWITLFPLLIAIDH